MADLVAAAEALEDEMRAVFKTYDENSDDALSPEELMKMLEGLGLLEGPKGETAADAEARKKKTTDELFAKFDDNKDGKIVFEEFKAHYNTLVDSKEAAAKAHAIHVKNLFTTFDTDNDSHLDKAEFSKLMAELELLKGTEEENAKKVDDFFEIFDDDKDGKLSLDEFTAHFKSF